MGYGMHFPAHQVSGQPELWDTRGYGLSRLWVMRGPTVIYIILNLGGVLYATLVHGQNFAQQANVM